MYPLAGHTVRPIQRQPWPMWTSLDELFESRLLHDFGTASGPNADPRRRPSDDRTVCPKVAKRTRTIFNEEQVRLLEETFDNSNYPDLTCRMRLAQALELPEPRIQVWFKNRRAKLRKKMKNIAEVDGAETGKSMPIANMQSDTEAEKQANSARYTTWKPILGHMPTFVTSSGDKICDTSGLASLIDTRSTPPRSNIVLVPFFHLSQLKSAKNVTKKSLPNFSV